MRFLFMIPPKTALGTCGGFTPLVRFIVRMVSKVTIAVVALLLAAIPTVAGATGIVQTGDQINFLGNASIVQAGPFQMRDVTNTLSVANPGGVADFTTFCVEYNETVVIGRTFWAEISDSAAKGGLSAVDPLDPTKNGAFGVSDPLGVRTAFLYRQFVDGVLEGLGLYNPGSADSRAGMQLAVWRLEGEVGVQSKLGDPNYNRYVRLNSTGNPIPTAPVFGSTVAAETAANNIWNYVNGATLSSLASYDVKVMRMWSKRTENNGVVTFSGNNQDQLVSVRVSSVPEPISTFSALLLGVSALGLARRRLAR